MQVDIQSSTSIFTTWKYVSDLPQS